jgi:non-ribosomal peptide synthetase component E (peptide arylation enzyme)
MAPKKSTSLPNVDSVISHHQRRILTYEALDRDSNALARGLQKRGVNKGDRVAVSLGNNIEFATVWLRHNGSRAGTLTSS